MYGLTILPGSSLEELRKLSLLPIIYQIAAVRLYKMGLSWATAEGREEVCCSESRRRFPALRSNRLICSSVRLSTSSRILSFGAAIFMTMDSCVITSAKKNG